ncbi:hypothetical protein B0T22DRAFT_81284 [Podospora appendiculata]|uniref:Uncharacterized protein n=1 Tax=Podospora appendiculata TaxID=314037 RepID=A0AAE1CHF1_9PEZI|nr:hypothetical protein B0T22DRAFT_81284 [Podospora appendiculata]
MAGARSPSAPIHRSVLQGAQLLGASLHPSMPQLKLAYIIKVPLGLTDVHLTQFSFDEALCFAGPPSRSRAVGARKEDTHVCYLFGYVGSQDAAVVAAIETANKSTSRWVNVCRIYQAPWMMRRVSDMQQDPPLTLAQTPSIAPVDNCTDTRLPQSSKTPFVGSWRSFSFVIPALKTAQSHSPTGRLKAASEGVRPGECKAPGFGCHLDFSED